MTDERDIIRVIGGAAGGVEYLPRHELNDGDMFQLPDNIREELMPLAEMALEDAQQMCDVTVNLTLYRVHAFWQNYGGNPVRTQFASPAHMDFGDAMLMMWRAYANSKKPQ